MALPGALRHVPYDALRQGVYWALGYLVATGLVSLLLPNTLFTRMTPIVWVDYILWPASAVMIGAFMMLRESLKSVGATCDVAAGGGGLAAFLGFSCPVCNKVLLLLLGTGGVLTFVEPYRTWIGLAGLALLGASLALVYRAYRAHHEAATAATEAAGMPGA